MTVYSVLSEFRFEAGQALATSDALQSKLQQVSGAADAVNQGLKQAAGSLLGQVGLYGGIGGAIYSAIKAADKYEQTQRSIANIFLSNNMFTGVNAFEASMQASAGAMENMKKAAREFSLPVSDFAQTAKLIGAGLVNHGLDDSSMKKTTDLTRFYLKSAPMLGVDPGLAQGELMDTVNGRAHMNARLVQRLVNETSAMRPYAGGGAGAGTNSGLAKFNALSPEKRLETLTAALKQFGSNAKIVEENAKSLSSQMQRLTDNITGMFSVLKPIGDAILGPLKQMMLGLNKWLESSGEETAKHIGAIIKELTASPEKLFADIQQLRGLKKDVHGAGEMLKVEAEIHGVTWALRLLGFELKGGLFQAGLLLLWAGLKKLGSVFVSLGGFTILWRLLSWALYEVVAPLVLFTTILQGITRGWAMAELANAKWLAENAAAIASAFGELRKGFQRIIAPITLATEGIAEMVKHLLSHNILWGVLLDSLSNFGKLLQMIGDIVVGVLSIISGSMQVMLTLFDAFTSRNFSKLMEIPDDFMAGFHLLWDRFHKGATTDIDTSQVSQNKIDVHNVTIQNQFKEQMEPDRIAFALKDQLMKAALNPLQASGGSMAARATR